MSQEVSPSDSAKPLSARLRVALAFLKDMGTEELKHFPVLRGFVAAVEKLSDQEASKQTEQRSERLLAIGEQTQEDVEILKELSALLLTFNCNRARLWALCCCTWKAPEYLSNGNS